MKRIPKYSTSGFTLVELMTVVAIIGFLVVMAIPAWNAMMPHFRLKTAAREVSNLLQQARMDSVANNAYTQVVVNYENETVKWRRLPISVKNRQSKNENWKDVDIVKIPDGSNLMHDSDLSNHATNLWLKTLKFRPDGTAVFGTTILDNQVAIYLQNKRNPSELYRVRIVATGVIKVEKRIEDKWK